jgi:hypothetical protein
VGISLFWISTVLSSPLPSLSISTTSLPDDKTQLPGGITIESGDGWTLSNKGVPLWLTTVPSSELWWLLPLLLWCGNPLAGLVESGDITVLTWISIGVFMVVPLVPDVPLAPLVTDVVFCTSAFPTDGKVSITCLEMMTGSAAAAFWVPSAFWAFWTLLLEFVLVILAFAFALPLLPLTRWFLVEVRFEVVPATNPPGLLDVGLLCETPCSAVTEFPYFIVIGDLPDPFRGLFPRVTPPGPAFISEGLFPRPLVDPDVMDVLWEADIFGCPAAPSRAVFGLVTELRVDVREMRLGSILSLDLQVLSMLMVELGGINVSAWGIIQLNSSLKQCQIMISKLFFFVDSDLWKITAR